MSNWTFRTVAPNEILRFNLFGQSIRRFDLPLLARPFAKLTSSVLLSERFCHFVSDSHRATAHFALLKNKGYAVKPMPRFDKSSSARTSPRASAFRAIALFHCLLRQT